MLAFIIVSIILVLYYFLSKSRLSHIPGPRPVPLFGNALQLDAKRPHATITEFKKQYGGVIKLSFFGSEQVFVSDPDLIYDMLIRKGANFADKPPSYRLQLLSDNFSGVIFSSVSENQKYFRKIMHTYIKQYGVGMERNEEMTMQATNDMVQQIMEQKGKPVKMHELIAHCLADIITIMLVGSYHFNQEESKSVLTTLDEASIALGPNVSGLLLDTIPLMRYFGNYSYQKLQSIKKFKHTTITKWLDSKPQDGFINFLQNMQTPIARILQINLIYDILAAAIFTSSSSLAVLINVLAHLPNIQEKLRDEVSAKIGDVRNPTVKDKEHMPYHQAVIFELGRYASILPLAPRMTTCDTTLGQYSIPRGTTIMPNLWSLHHDEKLWDRPFEFIPERFLDDQGLLVPADHPNRNNSMPFGAGPRVCVGEVLALTRMFLILARLMQCFVIEPETTIEDQPSMDPRDLISGIALLPSPYKVRLNPRNP